MTEDTSKIEENRFRRRLSFEDDVRERRCVERESDVVEVEGVKSGSSRCRIELRLVSKGFRGLNRLEGLGWYGVTSVAGTSGSGRGWCDIRDVFNLLST